MTLLGPMKLTWRLPEGGDEGGEEVAGSEEELAGRTLLLFDDEDAEEEEEEGALEELMGEESVGDGAAFGCAAGSVVVDVVESFRD
jgi:hypothetical protein